MTINKQALQIPEREKHNWGQAVMHTCDFCDHYAMTITTEDGEHSCARCCDAEYTTVLRCALEMAIDRATAAEKRIAELVHNHRVHAARLIDERGQLKQRITELEARVVTLPQRQEPTSSGHYGEGYLVQCADGSALDYDDTVDALVAAGVIIKVGE